VAPSRITLIYDRIGTYFKLSGLSLRCDVNTVWRIAPSAAMEANRYMRSTVLGIVATKAVEPVLKFKAPTPTPGI